MYSETTAEVGRRLYFNLFFMQVVLVALLAPLLTSSAIAGERQRRTLEGLLLTRMTGREIVVGKYLAGCGFCAMTLLCMLPVLAVAFLLGGVAPWEFGVSQLLLFSTAGCIGAIGLYCSARFHSAITATIATYLIAAALISIFTLVLAVLPFFEPLRRIARRIDNNPWAPLCYAICVLLFVCTARWVLILLLALTLAISPLLPLDMLYYDVPIYLWGLSFHWHFGAIVSSSVQLLAIPAILARASRFVDAHRDIG